MKNKIFKIAAGGIALLVTLGFSVKNHAPENSEPSLKQVLLDQLKSTHNQKEWFVPVNTAVEGLTAEQAMWQDQGKIHSVAELTNHLIFWNERQLEKFKGQKPSDFNGKNEETFLAVDKKSWPETVKKLDRVLSDWEQAISAADDSQLKSWYTTISRISTHNAYHTGEIIYVRKLQGSWDPNKGVK